MAAILRVDDEVLLRTSEKVAIVSKYDTSRRFPSMSMDVEAQNST